MPAPIDLKFSGGILGTIGYPAVGLMKKCMIHFKSSMTTTLLVISLLPEPFIREKEV